MSFWYVSVVPKYLNFATFSSDSLAVLIFWFCPEFGWRDIIIYFVFRNHLTNFSDLLNCTVHTTKLPNLVPVRPDRLQNPSSVSTVTTLRDGRPGFHFRQGSSPALGPPQPPTQWVRGTVSPGVKGPGRETGHLPPSHADIKNTWSYTSISQLRFHGVVLSLAQGQIQ
jgi:hypothetical protein